MLTHSSCAVQKSGWIGAKLPRHKLWVAVGVSLQPASEWPRQGCDTCRGARRLLSCHNALLYATESSLVQMLILLGLQLEQSVTLPSFYSEDTPASANETWARLHSDPLFAVRLLTFLSPTTPTACLVSASSHGAREVTLSALQPVQGTGSPQHNF